MSTPKRVPRIAEQDEESSNYQEATVSIATRPKTRSRTKRFEIGFFVRKVVNGWVVFYKQFPLQQRAQVHAQVMGLVPKEPQGDDAPEYGAQRMMAMSAPATGDLTGGGVTTKSGTGMGSGDGGPIGGTRVDAGIYVATITDESSTSDDDEDA